MHIADGVLSGPVIAATGALAVAGVAAGLRSMDYRHVPRVGVLSAAFFVASLIHVPIGPSSAHLLLSGLMGFVLGWAAFPALAVALLLQAILFGFGGVTSLGANVLVMGVPAVACHVLFARRLRSTTTPVRVFALGFAAGVVSVLLSCILLGITLLATGREFAAVVWAVFLGHIPVMVVEGFATGSTVAFVFKVRPELLDRRRARSNAKEIDVD